MQAKAARKKGNRFENHIMLDAREALDKDTHRVAGSGAGIDKNDILFPNLEVEAELKNAATFNIQGDWEQVERQKTQYNMSVLIVRHPKFAEFKKTLVVMDYQDWKQIMMERQGEVNIIEHADPKKKWAIQNLKEACNKVLKQL